MIYSDKDRNEIIDYCNRCLLLNINPVYENFGITYDESKDSLILTSINIENEIIEVPDIFDEIGMYVELSNKVIGLYFGERMRLVNKKAFYGASIRYVSFMAENLVLEERCFSNCCQLVKVKNKGLYSIGKKAFQFCQNLSYINLKGVQYVDDTAFYGCKYFTDLIKYLKFKGDIVE